MIVVVMGVSGAGKTAVGRLLARELGCAFAEGDDFHPGANVAKMRRGEPLDDDDRRPWLEAMAARIADWGHEGRDVVLACSALKRSYREILAAAAPDLRLVYLCGTEPLIRARLQRRQAHFMPASLLASQFQSLEVPDGAENVVTVDVDADPEAIVAETIERLGLVRSSEAAKEAG